MKNFSDNDKMIHPEYLKVELLMNCRGGDGYNADFDLVCPSGPYEAACPIGPQLLLMLLVLGPY